MEKDIYDILVRHFQELSSPEEEKRLESFRKEHAFEYEQLKKLWLSNAEIKPFEFDTDAAWEKVRLYAPQEQTGRFPWFGRKSLQLAALILLLISLAFALFFVFEDPPEGNQYAYQEFKAQKSNELLLLDDGSQIWLNKGAAVSYPEKFTIDERRISLSGEAYFEVEKDANRPFIIESSDVTTRVLGTSFNINHSADSTRVTVASGSVEVSTLEQAKISLLAGEVASVKGNNLRSFPNENPNYLSWKTGIFRYEEVSLREIVKDLNGFYEVQILMENNAQNECKITAVFDNQKLEEIIMMIELTCGLNIEKEESIYRIP